MKKKRLWIGSVGVVSFACVFVGEFPYSLLPFALFTYLALPGTETEADRRSKSRLLRRGSSALRKTAERREFGSARPVRILDPIPETSPAAALPAATAKPEPVAAREERVLEETLA